ncbi:LysR family transcriptional regulator [Roseibium porphyridii]|uniref:LysR family transcriptional regulator n=1 Tax=Roseibium porphyridii TaxID=2866279 RepID=A0ABY8F9T5_9HYPH|nr:LysR family transcriptional regulator [Roseibium sp. KMA01]WFE91299.1 LysR family transcriptional regulator [Roseibium sp. KMA01]
MYAKHRIDLRLLTYFHTVAATGNITKAAEELNIAQPTLSKALKLLERQTGTTLMERSVHGIKLTPIGERLQQHATIVLAQVGKALDEVDQLRTGGLGEVRVGAGPSWVRRFLPEIVAEMMQESRDIKVEIVGGFDDSLTERLEAGELDFIVAELPLAGVDENEVDKLTTDNLVVVGRPEHPLAGRKNVSAAEALSHDWALPPANNLARRKLDGGATTLGLAPPRPEVVSSSQTFLMTVVHLADLLLYTTRTQLKSPEGKGLVEMDVPQLITSREAGIIYRTPRLLSPAAALLAERLKEACKQDPFN